MISTVNMKANSKICPVQYLKTAPEDLAKNFKILKYQ